MPTLEVVPVDGINRRYPQHKLTGKSGKTPKQYCQQLWNLINLAGKFTKVPGASRYDATAKSGTTSWAKRIYYEDSGNRKHFLFTVIGTSIYKGDDSTGTLNRMTISNNYNFALEPNFYPISAAFKTAGTVATYMVDGKYFYKFNGNAAGDWERLPIKTDIDGNTIEPIYVCEYLDRLWVLCKNRNVLIGSANLNPELLNDATDSILIELPPGTGGFPSGLAVHPNGYLYVIHEDYFVPLSGSSASTFGIRPGDIVKGYGTNAPRSIVVFNDSIGFLNARNLEYYKMNDLQTPLSYEINLATLINPVKSNITVCHLDTTLNCLRIAYYPTGGTTLGDEEIYSLDEQKWCGQTRGRNISCYAQWNGDGDDGRLTTGRSDTGLIMVNDATFNFDSQPIRIWFISASYVAKDEITEVQFNEFYIDARPDGNYVLPVRYYLDARLTYRGEANPSMQGELYNDGVFQIQIAEQTIFVNRELFYIDYSKGRMIRFEIDWADPDRSLEFYGLYCTYETQEHKLNKFIGGR